MIQRLIGSNDAVEDYPLIENLGAVGDMLTAKGAPGARH